MEGKTLLDLGYTDDLSALGKKCLQLIEFLLVLRSQGSKIDLKTNIKKTKSLSLGINEVGEVMSDNEKIGQVDSFNCLDSIISKGGQGPGCLSTVEKVWKIKKIRLRNKIRMLEATVVTMVKDITKTCTLWKREHDLLGVFKRNCLRIVLGTCSTDHTSNNKLFEKTRFYSTF